MTSAANESFILVGDCREALRELPDESVHCVVTSPPYWGLRDYGVAGQLGLEATLDEYVAKLVEVFREVRRVLRKDGTLWLNLGDSYVNNPGNGRGGEASIGHRSATGGAPHRSARSKLGVGLKPKDLVGIPWRVAFALQADGWYLRSDIIWSKPNPMPESVRDRPTRSHEYIFLLTKSAKYYYDADAVAEPATHAGEAKYDNGKNGHGGGVSHTGQGSSTRKFRKQDGHGRKHAGFNERYFDGEPAPITRNRRDVWTVTTKPFKGAHFATFPPDLIEPCILAGTSERGCCASCGAAWKRETETEYKHHEKWYGEKHDDAGRHSRGVAGRGYNEPIARKTTGWASPCACAAGAVPCTVLDPFFGAGTTGLVAQKHGRNWIGCELNEEYAQMAFDRISKGGK